MQGKKLHTGRSRNDQVALDMRFIQEMKCWRWIDLFKEILEVLLETDEGKCRDIYAGIYTFQKAQPITLAHHMGERILRCSSVTDSD